MKAYTSSSSSRAMSVARGAIGSWRTSPASADPAAGSSDGRSAVISPLSEQISAQQVGGTRPLHVWTGMHDHVPTAVRGRVGRGNRGLHVHIALGVGDDLVQPGR